MTNIKEYFKHLKNEADKAVSEKTLKNIEKFAVSYVRKVEDAELRKKAIKEFKSLKKHIKSRARSLK